jgi:hypothetical protein
MTSQNALLRELDTLPSRYMDEVFDFVAYLKQKHLNLIPETALLSEAALSRDWDSPEEDDAWADL